MLDFGFSIFVLCLFCHFFQLVQLSQFRPGQWLIIPDTGQKIQMPLFLGDFNGIYLVICFFDCLRLAFLISFLCQIKSPAGLICPLVFCRRQKRGQAVNIAASCRGPGLYTGVPAIYFLISLAFLPVHCSHRFTATSQKTGSSSIAKHLLSNFSAAIICEPDPQNGS